MIFLKSKIITLDRKFFVKCAIWCLFILYTLLIIDFTLINDNFGRNISSNIFLADNATVDEYLAQKVNLVPFATVKIFINAFKDSNLETWVIMQNILGNIFVFVPFAFLIPAVFKRVNSWLKFLAVISIAVIVIEALQVVFLTGIADIDDFILNVGGAMTAYLVLNLKGVKRGVNKILFGENNET